MKYKIIKILIVSIILINSFNFNVFAQKIGSLKLYRNKMVLVANDENNIPIATFSVSCNKKRTPLGTRLTGEKIRWHKLYGDDNYGQYCIRYGDVSQGEQMLLHSVLYSEKYNPLSLKTFYNKDGSYGYNTYNGIIDQNESGGCIRLRVCDAKWLYENITFRTPLIIEDTEENIKRPKYLKIPRESFCDPTDIELAMLLQNGCNLDDIKNYYKSIK